MTRADEGATGHGSRTGSPEAVDAAPPGDSRAQGRQLLFQCSAAACLYLCFAFGAEVLRLPAMGVDTVTIVEPNAGRRAYLVDHCGQRAVAAATGSYDLVIDAVGYAATRATASALACPGGVIAHVGLGEDTGGLDIRRMTLQEITFIGTYTYTAQDFRDTAQALFDGRLGPLDWTETAPLAEGADAFARLRAGKVAAPKIVLTPWT